MHAHSLTRLVIGWFSATALLLGGVFALLLISVITLRNDDRQAQRSSDLLAQSFAVERSIVDLETGLRGFLLTRQPQFLPAVYTGKSQAAGADRDASPPSAQPAGTAADQPDRQCDFELHQQLRSPVGRDQRSSFRAPDEPGRSPRQATHRFTPGSTRRIRGGGTRAPRTATPKRDQRDLTSHPPGRTRPRGFTRTAARAAHLLARAHPAPS
jgi:CHASE3 domain